MSSRVWLEGRELRLDGLERIGAGGEAEVFALADGRVLKRYKAPDHPDHALDPTAGPAARARLDEQQHKLPAFPSGLPRRVISPETLAFDAPRGGRIVGYAMQRVTGAEPLARWSDPRRRRGRLPASVVVETLEDLHATVAALHALRIVVGDFNDLNVLVRGGEAYLIDADSIQLEGFPCRVFTQRFVDPRLCDPSASSAQLVRPHDVDSDWFAFAVMVIRSLLCVGPYGGVHQPARASRRVSPPRRALARISVFDPEVIYPRPALPLSTLPEALREHLRAVFEADRRGEFPLALLRSLSWTRCHDCGLEHARAQCPVCRSRPVVVATVEVRGQVSAELLLQTEGTVLHWREGQRASALTLRDGRCWIEVAGGPAEELWEEASRPFDPLRDRLLPLGAGALHVDGEGRVQGAGAALLVDRAGVEPAICTNGEQRVWASGGALFSDGPHGPRRLGAVVRDQTRLWLGSEGLGLGLYAVGTRHRALIFRADRAGVLDGLELPGLVGQIEAAHGVSSSSRAHLFVTARVGGRVRLHLWSFDARGRLVGQASCDELEEHAGWLGSGAGACAVGELLLMPTDEGVVRAEAREGLVEVTRHFPDTAEFVHAGDRLRASPRGLLVISDRSVTRLALG